MLMMLEKKSKKRENKDATNVSGATKGEEKIETKGLRASEDRGIKRKKERSGGKQPPGKSSKDNCEDVVKSVVKRKNNLKNEEQTMHDALLDTKTIAHNCVIGSEVKRKKRKTEKRKKEDANILTGVNQGDASTIEEIEDSKTDNANIRKRKKTKLKHNSEDLLHERSEKRVRFSCDVQVHPPSSDPIDEKDEIDEENLLWGKRFTLEEDEIVKEAIYRYIEAYDLGEEGLEKVLDCKSNPELRGCWRKIATAIPYRPYRAVYYRAQRLFRMGEKRKWTDEEYEMVRKFHGEHGPKWRVLADELGKHSIHVGNAWQRIKLANRKKGSWAQEEIQTLFDLVNTDLQLKLHEEKKSKHGMLRDNICWSVISDRLSTRISQHCCNKWYRQLTSPMVASGDWADTDDYRLIDALFELDASCLEDVDWDNLLDHREGELCRKRWNQMVRQLSKHENKSFAEQVEVLAKRYRPDLVGAREAWDTKPVVP